MGGFSQPAMGQSMRSAVEEYRDRITQIYSQHNPSKLSEIPNLLAKYKDKEHELYMRICQKYKVSPSPQYVAPAGGPGFGGGNTPNMLGGNFQQPPGSSPFGAPQNQNSNNP